MDVKNRDNKSPEFPLQEGFRTRSSFIYKAHKIILNGLEVLFNLTHLSLGMHLSYMTQTTKPYYNENGLIISSYKDVWNIIWKQYNETLCENYATKQFENDKLDLCSVARYVFHQIKLKNLTSSIVEKMGVALMIKRCDICLPYNRNGFSETIAYLPGINS